MLEWPHTHRAPQDVGLQAVATTRGRATVNVDAPTVQSLAAAVKEFVMPFPHPMRPYTRENALTLNPNQNGVYGIFARGTAVYVGSGDLHERLLAHLGGDNPCITRHAPDTWTGFLVSGDPTRREGELIREYDPVCNRRVPG